MSITEKLTSSKNALASLLDYANAKTEKNDPDIGEAIRTLVDGYGQGGGGNVIMGTITPSEMTQTLHFPGTESCTSIFIWPMEKWIGIRPSGTNIRARGHCAVVAGVNVLRSTPNSNDNAPSPQLTDGTDTLLSYQDTYINGSYAIKSGVSANYGGAFYPITYGFIAW